MVNKAGSVRIDLHNDDLGSTITPEKQCNKEAQKRIANSWGFSALCSVCTKHHRAVGNSIRLGVHFVDSKVTCNFPKFTQFQNPNQEHAQNERNWCDVSRAEDQWQGTGCSDYFATLASSSQCEVDCMALLSRQSHVWCVPPMQAFIFSD